MAKMGSPDHNSADLSYVDQIWSIDVFLVGLSWYWKWDRLTLNFKVIQELKHFLYNAVLEIRLLFTTL